MITAARNIRKTREGTSNRAYATGRKAERGAGLNVRTVPGVQRMPGRRETRRRPSDAPRQPRIHIGMWVLIKLPCGLRGCGSLRSGWTSWRHGHEFNYHGVIEQKRGDKYLVVTRLYGSFWAGREHMYTRDHNGITWTTPLLVTEENEGMVAPGMAMVQPCRGPHRQ